MKDFFKMLRFSNIKSTLNHYGASLSLLRFMVYIIGVGLSAVAICFYLKLSPAYISVVSIITMLMVPSILLSTYKSKYEANRFDETVNYLEQMIYSFRKKQKVKVALEDVYSSTTGYMKSVIKKAIDFIEKGEAENDLYGEALEIISNEYDCSRIDTLHSYFREVEVNGGDSRKALSVLLNDIRDWSIRTLKYQQSRYGVKKRVGISILLSLFTCSIMFNFIPEEYISAIVGSSVYQIITSLVLISCVFFFTLISKKVAGSYLDNEQNDTDTDLAMKYYEKIQNYDSAKAYRKVLIEVVIMIAMAAVCFILNLGYITVVPLLVAAYLMYSGSTELSRMKKRVEKAINSVFPTWLRNLILHLQTDNVHVALANSIKSCPPILKPEIKNLLLGIAKSPNSIEPYSNFLKDYNAPEMKNSIKFLYSLAEFGTDDMVTQLDELVRQNSVLTTTAEEIKNEDSLTVMNMLTYAPMIFACGKLLVDLALFFNIFMGYMSSFGM